MMEHPNDGWFKIGTLQYGLLLGAAGAAIAFMLIFMGFFKTLLVCALFAIGFWLGTRTDKSTVIKTTINHLFPPKGE
ncbi:MAG: DUF2273 domain-containing protein [Eubacteriales bacterium]|nr:DUF2273 domain-containing protein [Eubacteriales bacterium]